MNSVSGFVGRLALIALAAVIMLAACTLSSYALDIKITGDAGAWVKKQGESWEDAETDMVLSTCDSIILPGYFSWLTWERVGGCGNKGRIETGQSHVKKYHVGTDVPKFVDRLQAGLFDLELGGSPYGEAIASDATIADSSDCEGTGHCGLFVHFAQAAPVVDGVNTLFYGCLQQDMELGRTATFWNKPESDPGSLLLVEILAGGGGVIELPPDHWAMITEEGEPVVSGVGPPPECCGGMPPSSTERGSWGSVKSLYR